MALPLGISFYTFHAISYIADVAKGKVAANRRFGEFMLYMSMFPQLVAGPIVRYSQVANQLRYRRQTPGRFSAGMRIFIIGLAWKLLIADQISGVADFVFDGERAPLLIESWLGLYAYAMQIYFDFGGYSAMAVGLGIMVGFTLPRNFRVPYSASSITAFWRRWHMSFLRGFGTISIFLLAAAVERRFEPTSISQWCSCFAGFGMGQAGISSSGAVIMASC